MAALVLTNHQFLQLGKEGRKRNSPLDPIGLCLIIVKRGLYGI
jgi:hypothetical protein